MARRSPQVLPPPLDPPGAAPARARLRLLPPPPTPERDDLLDRVLEQVASRVLGAR